MQGIYKLEFKDGSIYVGQARDIRNRWSQHLRDMESNKHPNKLVQAKFDLFGFPGLEVLEYTSELDERESAFIKEYRGPLLLNIRGTRDTNCLKMDAVLMMQQGTKIAEVSQLLNIPASTLYRWRSEMGKSGTEPGALEARITQLEAQLEKVLEYIRGIKEVLDWAERKMRSEQKQREERYQDDPKPGLILGRRT